MVQVHDVAFVALQSQLYGLVLSGSKGHQYIECNALGIVFCHKGIANYRKSNAV